MWWLLAFLSAAFLGCYDSFKKMSLKENAVLPVLFLNTVFCALIFSPWLATTGWGGWEVQRFILLKSVIVLSSWIAGYFALKHLPLTIVGPVNATRPVLVLLGAVFLFGERLNLLQSIGVGFAFVAFYMLGRSGKKEGIDFTHNKWIFWLIVSVLMGAASGLYDKFLMSPTRLGMEKMQVLSWYSLYQSIMMLVVLIFIWRPIRATSTPFKWRWSIPLISMSLCAADYAYMQALSQPEALIAVVSMIRRGSVLVSFAIGAFILKEKNLRSKAVDLVLLLISMLFLFLGSN